MKIEKAGVGYESNFKPKSIKFEIGDPSILIGIVRDKLYSDKVRVFIQEYISNARDANREVGRPDWELNITPPSKVEPYFKVRDYGPGLSPDRIQNVFVKFGSSTKRKTDDYIGGFGIGAKSAWAYTDSFVVKSFYEGTETHYLCHLGTEHDGSADVLFEGTTDQPNGVEIQVQVKEKDLNYANDVINQLIRYWPKKPNISAIDAQYERLYDYNDVKLQNIFPQVGLETKDLGIEYYLGKNYGSSVQIVLDGIPYPMPQNNYLYYLLSNASLTGVNGNGIKWIIRAQTGELSVAANRESLEVNDKLNDWVQEKTISLFETLIQVHQHAFENLSLKEYLDFQEKIISSLKISSFRPIYNAIRAKDKKSPATSSLYNAAMDMTRLSEETIETIYHLERKFIAKNFLDVALKEEFKKTSERILVALGRINPGENVIMMPIPEAERVVKTLEEPLLYFKKEKVWLYGDVIYPESLYGEKLIIKTSTVSYTRGGYRRESGSSYYQKAVYCWGNKSHKEFMSEAGWFELRKDDLFPTEEMRSIMYNDGGWSGDKIKLATKKIMGRPNFIIDSVEIPRGFEEMGGRCKPLSENISKTISRVSSERVTRKTGSMRKISVLSAYNDLHFGSFEEVSSNEELIQKANGIVYMWTSDTKSSLSRSFNKISRRIAMNGWQFLQINKTAHKYLCKTFPEKKIQYYKDWQKE